MSTFLFVLLLDVVFVASVQGLAVNQLKQILENVEGPPASDDVGWYYPTKTTKAFDRLLALIKRSKENET
ncbi:hypothetical protein MAR_001568 [Mya arenaria]|uniref:Uncharacterized protein n=1 Tax=Mya arenaria TaxID=6604 RepID=A0ABY7FC34_MYAAR|nr:hypothetical protein MAR_001568 [Mya arenaria]